MVKELVTERLKLIDLYPDKAKSIAKEYGLEEGDVELIRKGKISMEANIDREARTVVNYISTDVKDRDDEVLEHQGVVLDDYKRNPIVPWAHDYRELPIGKNLWIKSDKKGLVAKTYFLTHDFAEDVFELYTKDIHGTGPAMNAWSVGFVPLKWKDAEPKGLDGTQKNGERGGVRRTYKEWLLLEYSAVPVPSNPEALTLMVEKGLIKSKKIKGDMEAFITKTEEASEPKIDYNEVEDVNKKETQISAKNPILNPEENDKGIRSEEDATVNDSVEQVAELRDLVNKVGSLEEQVTEIKEGRVLSGKNLKLVKDCREQIEKTGELLDKLIVASEPLEKEPILSLITESKGKDNGEALIKENVPIVIEEVLNGIKEGMIVQRKEIQDAFDSKLGKV